MHSLCLNQLVEITGGQLKLGAMPPLDGVMEPIERIVIDSGSAGPGDVFWALQGARYNGDWFVERAFARGALGAIVGERYVEPWAGKFAVHVDDANASLARFMRCLSTDHLRKNLVFVPGFDAGTIRKLNCGCSQAVVQDFTAGLDIQHHADMVIDFDGDTESSTTVS